MGACLIEKHFILDRQAGGADSGFSIEPEELGRLVTDARDAWMALGKAGFERESAEEGSMVFRRSISFVRDVKAEELVTTSDIRRIRPGFGLPPKYFNSLIGKKLKVNVSRGMPTAWDQFHE